MRIPPRRYATVLVGGGPAGTAFILAAIRAGRLGELLDRGLAIVDASPVLGGGNIGNYAINSDSTANTFIDCITNGICPELNALSAHPLVREFMEYGERTIPLHKVGPLQMLIGAVLQQLVGRHPACAVYNLANALAVRQMRTGLWRTEVRLHEGTKIALLSQNIVSATGAHQPPQRLAQDRVCGIPLLPRCIGRLVQSGDIVKAGGIDAIVERLRGKPNPRIAIIGGSTSAVSVAHRLLMHASPSLFGAGAITLIHRRPLKLYFVSESEARAEGYDDFGPDDLCPITARVFRFAGLRFDAKELIMRATGIGGRAPEPRLKLHQITGDGRAAWDIIDGADIVVAAMGYRPHGLPFKDAEGRRIGLWASTHPAAPLVDDKCRILDTHQAPLPGLFAIGLAAGFVPRGPLGGEPSFSGQANGLWLWQTAVGAIIVDAVLAAAPETRPRLARHFAPPPGGVLPATNQYAEISMECHK